MLGWFGFWSGYSCIAVHRPLWGWSERSDILWTTFYGKLPFFLWDGKASMPLRAASFRTDTVNLLLLLWLGKSRKATPLVLLCCVHGIHGLHTWICVVGRGRERGSCWDGVWNMRPNTGKSEHWVHFLGTFSVGVDSSMSRCELVLSFCALGSGCGNYQDNVA